MISDKPMEEAGVKTEASDREVTRNFAKEHVMLGVEALRQIIDGKKISQEIKDEVKEEVAQLKAEGKDIALAVIQVGADPASSVYVRNKKRA